MTEVSAGPARKRLSPRKRAQRNRYIQYGIMVVLALVVIFGADWTRILRIFFNWDLAIRTIAEGLGQALLHTVTYSIGGFVLGLLAATLLALMRLSEIAVWRWLSAIYIEFFRGLPTLVVFIALSLMPLAFGGLSIPFAPYGTVWLALGIVGAAYMAETIRAGIQAVPRGQVEAARSLGMTAGNATRKIVLPQAFRIMIPPLTNELIMLIKDSSLVFAIGIAVSGYELTAFGRGMAANEANITPLVIAGMAYLLVTTPLSYVVRRMEAK